MCGYIHANVYAHVHVELNELQRFCNEVDNKY